MKRFHLSFLVVLIGLLFYASPAIASPSVIMNSQKLSFDVPPVVENGRILLPLRAIFEAMGAQVDWDSSTNTATAVKDGTTVVVKIGSVSPRINGVTKTIDVPAKTINGRTFAPLRFVCEAFGGTVEWNSVNETATIHQNQTNANTYSGPYSSFQTIKYPNGDIYEGEIWGGLRQGQGTYIWSNGEKYVGTWVNHQRNGQGTMTWPNGDKLVATWQNGKPNGQGTYTYADGEQYVGNFQDGLRHGQGTVVYSNGQKYVGEWLNGQKNGKGTYYWPDGAKYVGTWANGNRDGYATLFLPNGTSLVLSYNNGVLVAPTYVPTSYITSVAPITTGDVIESRIDGTFEGWDGDTIFKLTNGQIWQQSSYAYHYHYAYRPEVIIYKSGSTYKMHVEGVDKDISVIRLK